MFPVPSSFSIPPIRCMRPGVPGTAQARARVSGSRLYGQKCSLPSSSTWLGSVVKIVLIIGNESTSGSFQGSEPLAKYPSDISITGVRYFKAMRAASIAAWKQWPGL